MFGFGRRFKSRHKLTPDDFEALARKRAVAPVRARKIGCIAARQALGAERVDTHSNGREMTYIAAPGDWIATTLTAERTPARDQDGRLDRYVIPAARFAELYQPDGPASELGGVFRGRAVVRALYLPDGLDIMAPWGERQRIASGYLIANADEVYGIRAETFADTYEVLAG